jgi:predicted permease
MLKDLRLAARMLLQAKGWTTVVVASLAIGIGANVALFSAINGLLLKQLPVKDPNGLVRLRYVGQNDMVTSSSDYGFYAPDSSGQNVRGTFSYTMYQQFVADNRTMDGLFACAPYGRVNVVADGRAEVASAFISTGNYYEMLGVSARIGRVILPSDDAPAAAPVAVISSKYWASRFGNDPGVIGKTILANNAPVTIVGVLPPEFIGVQRTVDTLPEISFPLSLDSHINPPLGPPPPGRTPEPPRLQNTTYWWLQLMGRLKPGATPEQVQGNLEGVFQGTARAGLAAYLGRLSDAERDTMMNRNRSHVPRLRVESGSRGVYDIHSNEIRQVTILSAIVALLLLIVCANVANLLLSRATSRYKEISVRMSLGATRLRLVRQLLTESLLLASVGGALGVMVGYWGKQLLPGANGQLTPLDWRIALFVIAITALTGIVFGIAPALRASGVNVNEALKANSRGVVGSRTLLGKSLLVVQVAISLILLIGAGLFLRTIENLRQVDVGFNPQNLALFRINPTLNRYDEKRSNLLFEDIMQRVGAVPGVRSIGFSQPALLTGSINSTSIFVQGRTYTAATRDSIHRMVVSTNFFETMYIPIVRGRGFTQRDNQTAPKVVIINETAAKKYFANEDPLGKRFGHSAEKPGDWEIVGILRDVKYSNIREAAPPTMYVSYLQARSSNPVMAIRTAADPVGTMNEIRTIVSQVDPNLPMMDVSTQVEQIELRFQQEKLFAQAYSLFGGLALLLAAIGLFGLMSYSVARRTNEIGIRMALGAQRGNVLALVMRESLILVAAGIVIGLAAAFGLGRFVTALLYGLESTDAITMALAVVVMIVVSALAGYLPARRASRVDPMVALRYD